jgi:Zn-finger nucleic acid-binding protein
MADRVGIEIDYCPTCRGVWLDRGELDKIIERSAAVAPAVAPSRDDRFDDRRSDDRYDPRFDDRRKKKSKKKSAASLLEEIFDF